MARGLAFLVLLTGCTKASRYVPAPPPVKSAAAKPAPKLPPVPAHYAWIEPQARWDMPLVFVPESSKEWRSLKSPWTVYPVPVGGARTAAFGLPPLQALAALTLAQNLDVAKIKVPLGLPDPTPFIPAVNPPTYGQWKLGRQLFSEKVLLGSDGAALSCATCHVPERGFAEERGIASGGERNTLSLVNVAYNKRQFWDGRVQHLEETLALALADELPHKADSRDRPEVSHRWGGLVKRLAAKPEYVTAFKDVFGIPQPTQDAIAKVLATYLRTLLVGNSLYDQADKERRDKGHTELQAQHFLKPLDERAPALLKGPPDAVAQRLESGHRLFHGKAHCATCHQGPLFTDHGFYNTGTVLKHRTDPQEAGRFTHLPVGLKDPAFLGAFRTPSLRNLGRSAPYFHDGSQASLTDVVRYYDLGVFLTPHLSPKMLTGRGQHNQLNLSERETEDLVLFLHSLQGAEQ